MSQEHTESEADESQRSQQSQHSQQKGVEVQVYRSARRADTYLFLPVDDAYEALPEALQKHFGKATPVLNFWLHEERYLEQADATQVLAALAEQGFYLQLPPARDEPAGD